MPLEVSEKERLEAEAPVTLKARLLCAFAAFAGILFGYDSGYINGVIATSYWLDRNGGTLNPVSNTLVLATSKQSLIVSILSAGTFFGAIASGYVADLIGRRTTIIVGCFIYMFGVILQVASVHIPLLCAGRFFAGLGVGFVSAINILYMSEIAPKRIRGAIVSCYQFAITIGLLLAAAVVHSTNKRQDSGSYRIPIGIQFLYAIILAVGLFVLPESPRYFIKKGRDVEGMKALRRIRGLPRDPLPESQMTQTQRDAERLNDAEFAEIVNNYKLENSQYVNGKKVGVSVFEALKGNPMRRDSNIRKTLIGAFLQMFQQWTGVNFIFYYSDTIFPIIGIKNAFLISMITTIVNVCSTPISFWTIERFGRRKLLIWGAIGMCVCEFIVAIIGSATDSQTNASAGRAMVAFICIYIFFFASTWGPVAWVSIGELFPLNIRSKGVAISTASNWFWNCIIAVITPYLMGADYGNLGTKVFYLWGSTCACCAVFAYFLVPETKSLSLEQVSHMMAECSARHSAKWVPHKSFTAEVKQNGGTDVREVGDEKVDTI